MYEYQADVIRVIDGDTLLLDIDLGMRIHVTQIVRLLGVNAPEMTGEQRPAGIAAREWVSGQVDSTVRIKTHLDRNDKYGRLLVEVFLADGTVLNQAIIAAGHGVVA